jgi:hypothetical protein
MPRVGNAQAAVHIMARQPFDNRTNTFGGARRFKGWGEMPAKYRTDDVKDVAYWVYSYDTPIAWVETYGRVTMPPIYWDDTTAAHQRIAAFALGVKTWPQPL